MNARARRDRPEWERSPRLGFRSIVRMVLIASVALASGSWAQDYNPEDFLPLAVGNSWEYVHSVADWRLQAQGVVPFERLVEVRIAHTEEIEGHTYCVFSDMPYEEPPVPYFFVAGKKVRFDGNQLLFREQDGDVALYRFDFGVYGGYSYAIPETEADTLASAQQGLRLLGHRGSVARATIRFYLQGHGEDEWRYAEFVEGFGLYGCNVEGDLDFDTSGRHNGLGIVSATIDGVRSGPWDVHDPTAIMQTP